MSDDSTRAALPFIAWSRIWSPVVSEALRDEAWQALGLPGCFERHSTDFWSTFQVGAPIPKVPLLLHAALKREAGATRDDWMRVARHLGLRWEGVRLPPDQLGAACEVYACAIDREEPVLIEELRKRYLLPWSRFAMVTLDESATGLRFLPGHFEADLLALPPQPAETLRLRSG